MAHILEDRILVTANTVGTGNVSLGGAVVGYKPFSSVMANTDTCWYLIQSMSKGISGAEWEEGEGTWLTGNILNRTTVIRSSNANAAVSFSAGLKRVAMTIKAPADSNSRLRWRTALGLGDVSTLSLTGSTVNFLRADGTWQPAGGAGSFLPLSGGTVDGTLVLTNTALSTGRWMFSSVSAGTGVATARIQDNLGNDIWTIRAPDSPTTGGATGSGGGDFQIQRYNNSGTILGVPFKIVRATGQTQLDQLLVSKTGADGVSVASATGQADMSLKANSSFDASLTFYTGANARWQITKNATAEAGSNAGSDFNLHRYSDAGAFLGTVLSIVRSNGAGQWTGGWAVTQPSGTNPAVDVQASGAASAFLRLGAGQSGQAAFITSHTGGVNTAGTLRWQMSMANGIAETGANAGSNWSLNRYSDAGAYLGTPIAVDRSNGAVTVANNLNVNASLAVGTTITAGQGFICRAGAFGTTGNVFNFFWTGAALQAWIDSVNLGNVTITSDERVKKDMAPLAVAEEAYLGIEPIKFRYRDVGIFKDDGFDRWGFSAQNLQPLIRPAVIGDTTAVDTNGEPAAASIDTTPILAATVLQVQALLREVKALRAELTVLKGS